MRFRPDVGYNAGIENDLNYKSQSAEKAEKKEKMKINRRKRCWKHETSGCTAPEKAAGKLPIKAGIFMVRKLRERL